MNQSDIQNTVLSKEIKDSALNNYRKIILDFHERHYYPNLKKSYRNQENLVSESLKVLRKSDRLGVLMVFDGMRMDFWKYLKECIKEAKLPVKMEEGYKFAIIPTITEVSRHSIFSGNLSYNISEIKSFPGNLIFSESNFYEEYKPDEQLTGLVIRFIDNRIHISSSVKGEFVDFEGIINDFKRYVKTFVIPMLRHIFAERSVEVIITSDHGFVDINKDYRILDEVYDESLKDRIRELIDDSKEKLGSHSDMFLVSPSSSITETIDNRFGNDVIIIRAEEYGDYNIPEGIGGDALVFPKIYKYLWNGSMRYNHGSLSIFETMVPFVRLT